MWSVNTETFTIGVLGYQNAIDQNKQFNLYKTLTDILFFSQIEIFISKREKIFWIRYQHNTVNDGRQRRKKTFLAQNEIFVSQNYIFNHFRKNLILNFSSFLTKVVHFVLYYFEEKYLKKMISSIFLVVFFFIFLHFFYFAFFNKNILFVYIYFSINMLRFCV